MTAVLEAHGYGKRYRRGNWALRGVDLGVPEGSITALVGPNGSGKSTLIRSWIGFERPTEGRLTTGGIDPARPRRRRGSGRLRAPVAVPLPRPHGRRPHRPRGDPPRRVRHRPSPPATSSGCRSRFGARAGELSGGEAAQVGLALALGTRAPILLLDEPLASLDPLARREFLHLMVEAVRADGATALLSSHVITDIEQACDRLIVLGKGHTLLDLTIAEALAHHRIVDGRPRRGTRSERHRRKVPGAGRRAASP